MASTKHTRLALTSRPTLQDKFDSTGTAATGFDYLRIVLAVCILVWHSLWISTGSGALDHALWSGAFRFIPAVFLPMFFALSGFLVAGSLMRTRLHQFITLRILRLLPALAVEITLSAVVLGVVLTDLPLRDYLNDPRFAAYFLNIVGDIHYTLPGVFEHNVAHALVNGQLWTIPFEMECYLALAGLSLCAVLKRPQLFLFTLLGISIATTAFVLVGHPLEPNASVPGRALVLCFLTAAGFYLCRASIPYSHFLGVASLVETIILLEMPNTAYLAAFPVVYLTIWLGLMRPPAIRFGDLSYGVFLFHFPVEQTVMCLFPEIQNWWQLTLIALPATLVCAWLSWNLVEKQVLGRKHSIVARADTVWKKLRWEQRRSPSPSTGGRGVGGRVDSTFQESHIPPLPPVGGEGDSLT